MTIKQPRAGTHADVRLSNLVPRPSLLFLPCRRCRLRCPSVSVSVRQRDSSGSRAKAWGESNIPIPLGSRCASPSKRKLRRLTFSRNFFVISFCFSCECELQNFVSQAFGGALTRQKILCTNVSFLTILQVFLSGGGIAKTRDFEVKCV